MFCLINEFLLYWLHFALINIYKTGTRQKVEAIIARGGGISDPDAPSVLAETRFWITHMVEAADEVDIEVSQRMRVNAEPSALMVDGILGSDPQNSGLSGKNKGTPASSGLNMDVLRAFDQYNNDLMASVSGGSKQCLLSLQILYYVNGFHGYHLQQGATIVIAMSFPAQINKILTCMDRCCWLGCGCPCSLECSVHQNNSHQQVGQWQRWQQETALDRGVFQNRG